MSACTQAKLCNHTSFAENKLAYPSWLVQICKFEKRVFSGKAVTQRVHIITIDPRPLCVVSTHALVKLCNRTNCAENKLAYPSWLVQICKFEKRVFSGKAVTQRVHIITIDPRPLCVVSTHALVKLCNRTNCAKNKVAYYSWLIQICEFKKGSFPESPWHKGYVLLP